MPDLLLRMADKIATMSEHLTRLSERKRGMQSVFNDVLAFHKKFGCFVNELPAIPDERTEVLKFRLVQEEFDELHRAYTFSDLPGTADAIADLIYVLVGMAIAYGIDLVPVWEEVQRANMSKVGGATRDDGKILKPDGFVPPDIARVLARQKPIGGSK